MFLEKQQHSPVLGGRAPTELVSQAFFLTIGNVERSKLQKLGVSNSADSCCQSSQPSFSILLEITPFDLRPPPTNHNQAFYTGNQEPFQA